jgi:hypothetical protein
VLQEAELSVKLIQRRQGRIDSPGTGRLDPDDAAASHDRHGSDDLHRMDL